MGGGAEIQTFWMVLTNFSGFQLQSNTNYIANFRCVPPQLLCSQKVQIVSNNINPTKVSLLFPKWHYHCDLYQGGGGWTICLPFHRNPKYVVAKAREIFFSFHFIFPFKGGSRCPGVPFSSPPHAILQRTHPKPYQVWRGQIKDWSKSNPDFSENMIPLQFCRSPSQNMRLLTPSFPKKIATL